jgi:hypothetical protein
MSIKYLNPKSYGQVYQKLVNGYRKVKGKDPTGLDLIKIKLEAAEQIRNSEKIIKFPEEKITPFYEGRPSKGPQADVKKFPTKNKPAAQTYSSDFLDLLEEFNKISKNQPSLAEITGVSNKYPEKTGIVKSTIELLESKDPKSLSRELQRIMKREGTYVDYSDEEVAQILNGFESRTKNKIKPAEEMIDEGDFDPSGFAGGGLAYMLGEPVRMFKGGRIGYSVGAGKKGVQGLLDLVKNKFGKKSITTADKIARPEKAITKEMFDEFNKRLKEKTTPDTKNLEKTRGKYGSGEDLYKIFKKEGITINQAVKEALADMPRLSGDAKYDADAVAEVVYQKLDIDPDTLNQYHVLDVYDKAYNLLTKNKKLTPKESFLKQYFAKKSKEKDMYEQAAQREMDAMEAAADVGMKEPMGLTNEEIYAKYQNKISDDLLKKIVIDDNPQRRAEVMATLDEAMTMMEKGMDPDQILNIIKNTTRTKNAKGGRIGFSAGGIDKVRRAFLKLLGAGAGATAATKTGLFGLLKGKKEAKIATKAAEQVVKRNEPPAYVFDLVEIIRAKGKDITKSAQTIERETVKTYKGVDLYETPDGFRIRAEGKSAQEGGKEIDLMYSQMDEIKDEGLETQKSFTVTDYEEATVRPDAEGKMKDVDFYVDEADHKELKKIVDEEKNKFKSGGLAYMLGE